MRVLVDPVDPADVAAVTAIQDQVKLDARSSKPFEMPDYETSSFDATREVPDSLLAVAGLESRHGAR